MLGLGVAPSARNSPVSYGSATENQREERQEAAPTVSAYKTSTVKGGSHVGVCQLK